MFKLKSLKTLRLEKKIRKLENVVKRYEIWANEENSMAQENRGYFFKLYQFIDEAQDLRLLKETADRLMERYEKRAGDMYHPTFNELHRDLGEDRRDIWNERLRNVCKTDDKSCDGD